MRHMVTLSSTVIVCLLAAASTAVTLHHPLFDPRVDYGAGSGPQSVFAADLDGDGDHDLAVANWHSDDVSILKNNGDGTFSPAVDYAAGDSPRSVFAADFDGDGDNDLAVTIVGLDNVSILLNNGNGTFAAAVW